ncbi:hypothetical protein ACFSHT_15805 [Paraburkholderia silviterrae]|uniref:Uncharacterized protein n=1 Tax=Paraburkholderia silviterrae TaxID=2528715 RepID=A0A4R5M9E7_9BURK|nr:hypothetical protein [Paraburkholderia silviterrae]TDG23242.1 hypothetical protein EYW47_15030 [Paraburkholderia silviterrae]
MNFRPGILAVVKGCPVAGCNDQVVELVSPAAPFAEFGAAWNCTNARMRESGFDALPIPESMLRPIGGLPVHDEQRDEVTA